MRVLVINPGTLSTKLALFERDQTVFSAQIDYELSDFKDCLTIVDQLPRRLQDLQTFLSEELGDHPTIDLIMSRGGLFRHLASGTYPVTDEVIEDVLNPPYGEHASNLGVLLARELAVAWGIKAYFADPVSTDEMCEVARLSGFRGMHRESFFHALNHKAMARRACRELKKDYLESRLIVCHMGGGVSCAAHLNGRVIDTFNVKDEGCFSVDRGGQLPVNAVVNLCFSGLSRTEVKRQLSQESGVFSYLETKNFLEVERRAMSGKDARAKLVFDAFIYQVSKDIGAMAAVLDFSVDAIVLTGGIAHSSLITAELQAKTRNLAPSLVLAGEHEMQALAEAGFRILAGESPATFPAPPAKPWY